MSYKHNNLMAMRQRYWEDIRSPEVKHEKQLLQYLLNDLNIYANPSLDDAKYLFFSLPSIIIIKGYAMGFRHQLVQDMILQFIQHNRVILQQKGIIKTQYRMK
ncbi:MULTISPECIES: hypothetical protein [unclassified Acinetobacter]|uniref:hypothetical protein n=1 Tax=unclassified Acinetobacter TaxID=196816 RepID=UPI002934B3D1|nr:MULTISPECIES: hypothetical protein [unclassified Acinetobacter]WOE32112.1 hypothetical protein QSG84_02555 [Acinetobacter sp. SAAs470]WOE37581.1 hypothetical protein QSG86_11600 [Acinetobacter sp. SAAs474]